MTDLAGKKNPRLIAVRAPPLLTPYHPICVRSWYNPFDTTCIVCRAGSHMNVTGGYFFSIWQYPFFPSNLKLNSWPIAVTGSKTSCYIYFCKKLPWQNWTNSAKIFVVCKLSKPDYNNDCSDTNRKIAIYSFCRTLWLFTRKFELDTIDKVYHSTSNLYTYLNRVSPWFNVQKAEQRGVAVFFPGKWVIFFFHFWSSLTILIAN